MERSLTVLNNQEGLIPVRDVLPGRIAAVSIVSNEEFQATREKKSDHFNSFLDHISNYTPARLFMLPNDTTAEVFGEVITSLRSEEHTSELQSIMRISNAVFCLKKKK